MALITCPECGKEYSDKANACPNCGCPTNNVSVQKYDIQADVAMNKEMMRIEELKLEYDKIHRIPMFVYSLLQLAGMILVIVSIVEFFSGNLGSFIGCLIIGLLLYVPSTKAYYRNKELEKLISGQMQV